MSDDLPLIVPGDFMDPPSEMSGSAEALARPTGAEFGVSFRGSLRQNTLLGASSQAADIAAIRSGPDDPRRVSERMRLEETIAKGSPLEAAVARRALAMKEKRGSLQPSAAEQAEDAIIEQLAYENSGAFKSAAGVAGSFLGAIASPENLGGLSSLLVRQFPALAGRPILRGGIDAALTNTLTDPLVQGIRIGSGAQEGYDAAQTAIAPVVGFAAGGALSGAGVLAGRVADRMEFRSAIDPRLTPQDQVENQSLAAQAFDAPQAPPVVVAGEVGRPGLIAQGLDADAVKKRWRAETPFEDLAGLMLRAPVNQRALGEAGRQIEAETGVTFRDPGVKSNRDRIIEKMGDKKPGVLTDVVRSGFDVRTPDESDAVLARLAQRFEIIDEGWVETPQGYFDRKAYVRFEDGMIGEVQFWAPGMFEAKELRGGHKLYEEARSLAPDDPRVADLERQMRAIYDPVLASLGDGWKAPAGSGGSSGNRSANTASETTRADMPTSAEWALRQAPESSNTQASPGVQNAGSPSNMQGLGETGSANASTSNQNIAPPRVPDNAAPGGPRGETSRLIGVEVPAIPAHRVSTAAGASIDVRPVVVEAPSLRTSADAGYDAALQPRDRDRAASQAQIREIATRLDPERLGFSAEADRGAPIVGPDGMVESGNGRVLAIRRVYEQGGEAAQRYRDWLSRQGVNVGDFREPVLVRQRLTELGPEERQAFTVQANQAATLTMSAGERAMTDARLLSADTLDLIRNSTDLGAVANRDFVQAFIRGLPQSEQGMMTTAQGGLSSEGLTRVRNAVLARAYGDADLMARVAEATSDEIKSISNALVAAAPEWARFRADVEAGVVRADMDLTPELMEAVKRTSDLRAKAMTLDAFLRQQDAFDTVRKPVEAWMSMFYQPGGKRAAGGQAVAERLRFYATEARKVPSEEGLAFDLPPVRPEDIQALAAKRLADDAGRQVSGNLFEPRRAGDGSGDGARGPEAGRQTSDPDGRGTGRRRDGGDKGGPGVSAGQTPEVLARRRGAQPVAQPLPNQLGMGRPMADQGTSSPLNARVQRLEDISRNLVDAFQMLARNGSVQPGAQGTYNTRYGVIRVRQPSDFDTIAHEVGHSLHLGGKNKGDFDAIVRNNLFELSQFGAGRDAVGDAEAFANLFHAYVTNRPFAEKSYPGAVRDLDTLMSAKYPEQLRAIEEIRQALDVLHRAPSVDVVSADTITTQPPKFGDRFREFAASDRDPQGRVIYSAFDALYSYTTDSNHPIYRAMTGLGEIARGNGNKVTVRAVDDAYILARRLPGSHGRADTMLKYGVIPAGKVTPEGPSLSSGIEKALGRKWNAQGFEDLGAYLTARRMVAEYQRFFNGDLERPPGKLSHADYEKAVQDFEARYPTFHDAAADIYAFQKNHLKRMFDKGLVTREFYDASIARRDYVPAMRDMRNFEEGEAGPGRTGPNAGGLLERSVARRFRGSDRPVINPLESIFKRVHDIEFVIARNDAISALARYADQAGPGAGYVYEPVPSNQLKGQRVDVMEALKQAGKQNGVDEADMTHLLLQAEDVLGGSTWATLFRQEPITPGADPIVYHWVNGERRAGRLGDDRFGRELYHALTAMSDYEKDFLTSALALSSSILRAGITRSPDFILVNMVRDQVTSSVTAGRKYVPGASMVMGLKEALSKSDLSIEFAGQGGLAGGAIVDAIQSSQFGRNVKSLQGSNWFGELAKAFELSETGTRIGLYKSYLAQAKDMGFDAENAALYAAFKADDYIDFRKHGSATGVPRRLFTFFNAAVQGTDREIRAVADLPVLEAKRARGETLDAIELDRLKDARVAWVRLLTLSIVAGAGLAIYNAENDNVKNASKYNRAQNFLFSINGMDFSIPKGFGVVQSVINLFERSADFAMRRDPQLAAEWLEGMATAFTFPMSNPAVGLMYDLPANYDRFRDRPIVPYYMQGWDASEQYDMYTSSLSRQIAKAADAVGLKVSPKKLDYTFHNLGGGMARDVLFAWDVLMGNDRPEKQIYDYPVLRRFVKNLERGSQAQTAFYKLVGEKTGDYEQAENAYRGKINNGERQVAADYLRGLKDDERAWVTLNAHGFSTAEKRLHPMYNARERISVINGMMRQLVNNNVIREEDLDRQDLTRSRRDAAPIPLDPRQRAKLQEELLSLSVATTRNAMVTVGAKGTAGLGMMDNRSQLERIRLISPEVAQELEARLASKSLPEEGKAASAWPEMKRRLLVDGEYADLKDLIPPENRPRRQRRSSVEGAEPVTFAETPVAAEPPPRPAIRLVRDERGRIVGATGAANFSVVRNQRGEATQIEELAPA